MRICQVKLNSDIKAEIAHMDKICFPDDDPCIITGRIWWIAYEQGLPIAYAGLRIINDYSFLCRAGVLPKHRGKGIQKKLIKKRILWAKDNNLSQVITYTSPHNPESSNSLISMGFKLYRPKDLYAGENCLYWFRRI